MGPTVSQGIRGDTLKLDRVGQVAVAQKEMQKEQHVKVGQREREQRIHGTGWPEPEGTLRSRRGQLL